MRFGLIGAAGYVAPRHMQAIQETGNQLIAACDIHDSVGILDRFAPNCRFFTEVERFDRHLEKLKRLEQGIDYLSVTTPNYLHDAHCRLGLRVGADVICEKPVVINPWNVDQLLEIESESNQRIWTILQLRLHPVLQNLRLAITGKHSVKLTYHTKRGPWYSTSWKGDPKRSGGVAMNIGVHLFDLLLWMFGDCQGFILKHFTDTAVAGRMWLTNAEVDWELSIDHRTERYMVIDGDKIDFSQGFENLHTKSYEEILAGRGFSLSQAKHSISLLHQIRNSHADREQYARLAS